MPIRLCLPFVAIMLASLAVQAAEKKPEQGEVSAPSRKRSTVRKSSVDSPSEVLALNFVVPAKTCRSFDSAIDYFGATQVAISLLALNANLQSTRIIPYFGVENAPYLTALTPLRGSDFPFSDGAGGVVPVAGPFLRLSICNDGSTAITYTQLTAYVAARLGKLE